MLPLVSILIPAYNVSQSIERCLMSISEQTYSPLEIICVDDCSKDNSVQVIEGFAKSHFSEEKGKTIKLIRLDNNRGVANARNVAVDNATGEYIYFIDADDYIEKDTIELLVRRAEKDKAGIIGMGYIMEYEDRNRCFNYPNVNTGREAFLSMSSGKLRWNLWLYLIRRDLFKDIRFLPGYNMGEDMMVMGKLFLSAGKVGIINKAMYHYVQTNGNAITKDFNRTEEYARQTEYNMHELERFIRELGQNEPLQALDALKIKAKMPLLFEREKKYYVLWEELYPETRSYIGRYACEGLQEKIVISLAKRKLFSLLSLYMTLRSGVYKMIFG